MLQRSQSLPVLVCSHPDGALNTHFFQPEEDQTCRPQHEGSTDEVWQCIRVFYKPRYSTKSVRIRVCRICEYSAEERPNDGPNVEAHWQQKKSSRLKATTALAQLAFSLMISPYLPLFKHNFGLIDISIKAATWEDRENLRSLSS